MTIEGIQELHKLKLRKKMSKHNLKKNIYILSSRFFFYRTAFYSTPSECFKTVFAFWVLRECSVYVDIRAGLNPETVLEDFFFSVGFLFTCLCFPPWYITKGIKGDFIWVLSGWVRYIITVLWAFQPLIFIRVLETRYYKTDDPDYYATDLIRFAVYEKAEWIRKIFTWLQSMRQESYPTVLVSTY